MSDNGPFLSKETLTERYYSQIYAYCVRRLPDRDAAEDAAQEVFAAFWEGPDFTDETVALVWLYRVAKSKIGDFYRVRQRRQAYESDLPPEDLPDSAFLRPERDDADPFLLLDPDGPDGSSDPENMLRLVIGALSEKDRILFRQVWREKIPYSELAAQYGITEGALRTRISRLKKKITAEIRRLMPQLFPVLLLTAVLKMIAGFFAGPV